MLAEGSLAPDFNLTDQMGKTHKLSDYEGSWVLLYFYPKDDTSGCTTEACGFRDNYQTFEAKGLKVLGVSADSVDSHLRFTQKHNLNFTLLADPEREVIKLYEASRPWGIGTKRLSYLIDKKGIIRKVYHKVTPATHAEEVITDLEVLAKVNK